MQPSNFRRIHFASYDDVLRHRLMMQRQLRMEQERRVLIANYIDRYCTNAVMMDYVRKTTEIPSDSQLDFYGDAPCSCPDYMRDEKTGECFGRMAMNAQAASTSTCEQATAAEASTSETNGRDVNNIEDWMKYLNLSEFVDKKLPTVAKFDDIFAPMASDKKPPTIDEILAPIAPQNRPVVHPVVNEEILVSPQNHHEDVEMVLEEFKIRTESKVTIVEPADEVADAQMQTDEPTESPVIATVQRTDDEEPKVAYIEPSHSEIDIVEPSAEQIESADPGKVTEEPAIVRMEPSHIQDDIKIDEPTEIADDRAQVEITETHVTAVEPMIVQQAEDTIKEQRFACMESSHIEPSHNQDESAIEPDIALNDLIDENKTQVKVTETHDDVAEVQPSPIDPVFTPTEEHFKPLPIVVRLDIVSFGDDYVVKKVEAVNNSQASQNSQSFDSNYQDEIIDVVGTKKFAAAKSHQPVEPVIELSSDSELDSESELEDELYNLIEFDHPQKIVEVPEVQAKKKQKFEILEILHIPPLAPLNSSNPLTETPKNSAEVTKTISNKVDAVDHINKPNCMKNVAILKIKDQISPVNVIRPNHNAQTFAETASTNKENHENQMSRRKVLFNQTPPVKKLSDSSALNLRVDTMRRPIVLTCMKPSVTQVLTTKQHLTLQPQTNIELKRYPELVKPITANQSFVDPNIIEIDDDDDDVPEAAASHQADVDLLQITQKSIYPARTERKAAISAQSKLETIIKKFACEFCLKGYVLEHAYRNHITYCQKNPKALKTEKKDDKIPAVNFTKADEIGETTPKRGKFMCGKCEQVYVLSLSLKKHLNTCSGPRSVKKEENEEKSAIVITQLPPQEPQNVHEVAQDTNHAENHVHVEQMDTNEKLNIPDETASQHQFEIVVLGEMPMQRMAATVEKNSAPQQPNNDQFKCEKCNRKYKTTTFKWHTEHCAKTRPKIVMNVSDLPGSSAKSPSRSQRPAKTQAQITMKKQAPGKRRLKK